MSGFYAKALCALWTADIDWLVDDIRLFGVDETLYTVDLAVDEFLSSIPVGARVCMSDALTGKTVTGFGVVDADDPVVAAVTGHITCGVIVKWTGDAATSQLILYENCGTNLPVDLVEQDWTPKFDSHPARKIAALAPGSGE